MVGVEHICGHPEVARNEADALIMCDLTDSRLPGRWEQLWAKRIGRDQFELCSIPFFAYGLALGDIVTAGPSHGFEWVIKSVVHPSDNLVIRVLFEEGAEWETEERQHELVRTIQELNIDYEVHHLGYLSISCRDNSRQAEHIKNTLQAYAVMKWSHYEVLDKGSHQQ